MGEFTETQILVCVMDSDWDGAEQLIDGLLPNELATFKSQVEQLAGLLRGTRPR